MKKILVIDDAAIMRQLVTAVLERGMGWQVLAAENGREGAELARSERPDVVLLDLEMPEIDGFETCRLLKDDPETASLPILMLTATSDQNEIDQLHELGVNGIIAKPFSPGDLANEIADTLGWSISTLAG